MIPSRRYVDAHTLLEMHVQKEINDSLPQVDEEDCPFAEDRVHEIVCEVCYTPFKASTRNNKLCHDLLCREYQKYRYLDETKARKRSLEIYDLIQYGFSFEEVYDMCKTQSPGHTKAIYNKYIETEAKRQSIFDRVRNKRKENMGNARKDI